METEPPGNLLIILLIAAAVVLLLLSALFSISESSFLSMNKLRLRIKQKSGDKRAARVSRLLKQKDVLINTLLVANDLVNILLSAILAAVALALFGERGVGIAALATTVLLLIFGEITPKSLSTRNPDFFAYGLSGFVAASVAIFKPVSRVFTAVAHAVLHLFGMSTKPRTQSFTEEEIKTFIDVGTENGVLEKTENAMMRRVFKFTDLEVQDIMLPRTKITALRNSATYHEILETAERTHFSRFPVFRKDIDDIVGVLYIKDLLAYKTNPQKFSMHNVMREPLFILGTKKMSSAQHMLTENRQSLAIVVDEYSGTDGIITQDDISQEIFGVTEKSVRNKTAHVKIENTRDFIAHGSMLLRDVNELLHISLTSEINETLGGWLTEKINNLPQTGDSVIFDEYRFVVLSIKERRVNKVHVTHIESRGDT
ncbi:MAG: HlyC/CorC family transporter [Treponema sp.]|nr:HlyC/CorC family transporter [Treponema sp.]